MTDVINTRCKILDKYSVSYSYVKGVIKLNESFITLERCTVRYKTRSSWVVPCFGCLLRRTYLESNVSLFVIYNVYCLFYNISCNLLPSTVLTTPPVTPEMTLVMSTHFWTPFSFSFPVRSVSLIGHVSGTPPSYEPHKLFVIPCVPPTSSHLLSPSPPFTSVSLNPSLVSPRTYGKLPVKNETHFTPREFPKTRLFTVLEKDRR